MFLHLTLWKKKTACQGIISKDMKEKTVFKQMTECKQETVYLR